METGSLWLALLLALAAGLSVPLGALASAHAAFAGFCRRNELDSFVSYFGGGALLAAIALVLIPHGLENASVSVASVSFALGGLAFWRFSVWAERSKTSASQFAGMVMDFFPEAILVGVAVQQGSDVAYLLAVLIALQNMPEGFAAYQEMQGSSLSRRRLWSLFLLAPWIGPLGAWIGYGWLSGAEAVLSPLLLFCSGGILYLVFEDIAPQAKLKNEAFPAVGAIAGFLLGMVGTMLVH